MKEIPPLNPTSAKLRMQSPQKLRERLAAESRAVASAESSLQAELSKISEEIHSPRRAYAHARMNSNSCNNNTVAGAPQLESRLSTLSTKHAQLLTALKGRIDSLGTDIAESLTVSENKNRHLDRELREREAENEQLYLDFNAQMESVFRAVRGGEGEAQLKKRTKEVEEQANALRRENARLRREVLGLRSQLRDG